ncbi:MAG: chemotaxis response regulator protein-glutamate methylesterase [Gammaproteobacteria bacterium]|nr:MAG: chemotaxis response regulator protein-glutamate methylesterase [Gammaproteobacteria bacterium]
MTNKIKVLIVDDSALIRMLLTKTLSESPDIEVVGSAEDPFVAREMIKKLNPDVLTLDIEMPKMDGLTFLKNLMRLRPMPVIMVSTLTKKGANVTLKALEYGAVDFVAKPDSDIRENLIAYTGLLVEKIKTAAKANVSHTNLDTTKQISNAVARKPTKLSKVDIITVGASTGGTEAIKTLMMSLPTNLPPIVIAQHIPPVFSTSFAKRLNDSTQITVIEPTETMELKYGHAYLAPGDDHMKIFRRGGKLYLKIERTELVNRHRPSVDVLFNSVEETCGKNVLAVILTGMGNDGAKGLKKLNEIGAHTIAQDEATSVVWGMPGSAVALGAASEVLSLSRIPKRLLSLV